MLIVFQMPMADLRPFRAAATRRKAPHWPTPDVGTEFLRYFGPVADRNQYKRKALAWKDEQFFIDAGRALALVPFAGDRAKWTCAFRRLLTDGSAVVRFEIGFHIPPPLSPPGATAPPPDVPMLDILSTVLDTPCIVRGDKVPMKLVLTAQRLARLYAKASTPRGTLLKGDEIAVGQPTLLVQFQDGDGVTMPTSLDFTSDNLAFMKTAHAGRSMNIWFTNAAFGDPRNTRTGLLRLSAEHQCLKYVLRDLTDGNISLDRGDPASERLQLYLGDVGHTLSKESRFGVDQTELVKLTQTYETLCEGTDLPLLQQQLANVRQQIRTQILSVVSSGNALQPTTQQVGPPFQWQGNIPEIEYQSFYKQGRPPLDVAWMTDVLTRLCPAVCLINMPTRQRKATGFLVAKDLILTNWHVIEESPTDTLQANLADMELRFTVSSAPDRIFKLSTSATSPALVIGSPILKHDFALLRVAEDVAAALGVTPFACNPDYRPVKGQGINIIQHPGGGALVITADEDGVSGVYPDAGTVQYISNAQHGSSGSPCLNGQKQLVAIHHAELEQTFGSAREGILLSAVYNDLAPFLA